MLPEEITSKVLEASKAPGLNPVQELAVKSGLYTKRNMVVAAPTASGKTLIAEMAALDTIFNDRKKAIYIVPLRALANEKYEDFRKKYEPLVKVGISIGDYDQSDPWLANYDLIIATSEKMDSLLRHGIGWAENIGLVIADEIHLLDSPDRGPTLEVVLTRLMHTAHPKILGLSATISNYNELAEWLDAQPVKSDYRPVKLYMGVCHDNKVNFLPKKELTLSPDEPALVELVKDSIKQKKQSLVFLSTRKSAESVAERLGEFVKKTLSPEDSRNLSDLAEKVLHALDHPTKQCERLASSIRNGTAFHHAGLANQQRSLVENSFREGIVKVLAATPTLCLSGDSVIWNGTSEIKVSTLEKSHIVHVLSKNKLINMNAQEVQPIENMSNLIEISSVSGHSIKVTPNHRMLVKRSNKRMVIPAEDARRSDKIATVGKLNIDRLIEPTIEDFVKANKINSEKVKLDSGLSYSIGVMLGDGYSGAEREEKRIKYKGSPSIVGIDGEIFSNVKKVCKALNLGCRETKNVYGTPQLVLGKNKWFREFLVNCGVDVRERKHISQNLMEMDLEKTAALLRGLFDTDGYVEKKGSVGFSNTSEILIKQIQKLLLRFGIVSRIRKRKKGNMKIYEKEYKTKPQFELTIHQKRSVLDFIRLIGFGLERKQKILSEVVDYINSNINYAFCEKCNYKIYSDIFSGRSRDQREWGRMKLDVIKLLGQMGELASNEICANLKHQARKDDSRLNHHYELIKKRKVGTRSKTEWFWSLNQIGEWIFKNILSKNADIHEFFKQKSCPLCDNELKFLIKKGWRDSDFDGDIFWDMIRTVRKIDTERIVYNVVLPDKPESDHMFVANGFIVHNSAGLNLPAWRVIIRDLKRYSRFGGMDFIPVLEIHQMLGRAGRPKWDTEGQAILMAKSESDAKNVWDHYIKGEPEKIYSKLGIEPVLRMHVLGLISSQTTPTRKGLQDFFSKTFYAHQYKDMSEINGILDKVTGLLKDMNFITTSGQDTNGDPRNLSSEQPSDNPFRKASSIRGDVELKPTKIGRRVSELYIDPFTGHQLIKNMKISEERGTNTFGVMHMISKTVEMMPLLSIRKSDMQKVNEILADYEPFLSSKPPNPWDIDYDDYIRSIKTAWLFQEWAEEAGEDMILENFGVAPGELRVRLSNADWLLYSSHELALLMDYKNTLREIRKTRLRIKYGIREELLPLVSLRGVGRVRARMLFSNNLRRLDDLRKIPLESLERILGPKIAREIKEQVV